MLRDDISNDDGVIDDVVTNKVSVQIYVAPYSKETKTLESKTKRLRRRVRFFREFVR